MSHSPNDPAKLAVKVALAERIIGHDFGEKSLVEHALTHPSAVDDRNVAPHFERFEFLGDSVIGMVVAEEVFRRFPSMPEGGMTRVKVSVVNGLTMARVAEEIGLVDALVLGESEIGTGKRGLSSALENAYEALTAALYLDAGLDAAREWVLRTLGPLIAPDAAEVPENPKSLLQEIVQSRGATPSYRMIAQEGPPHDRSFTAVVEVDGKTLGEGVGRTKKEAEAAAAAKALQVLGRSASLPAERPLG